jgi:hypothetical protein
MANVVFQDIQICIYDVDGKEAAGKLDNYFEFGSDHLNLERDHGSSVRLAPASVPTSMPQSQELAQSLIGPSNNNNPVKNSRSPGHLRRQSSDAGDGNSVLLMGAGGGLGVSHGGQQVLVSKAKTYGSIKRENRLPRLPRKRTSRDGDNFENSPDAGDQSSLLLAKGSLSSAATSYGSDDVVPTASSDDERQSESRETHPLMMP